MAEDDIERERPKGSATGRPDGGFAERMERLEQRLTAQKQAEAARTAPPRGSTGGYAQAAKLASEFIAGVLVGTGIGWLLDRFAGTAPFGLIVFLLLGFAAGVLNVLRTQGMVAEQGEAYRRNRQGAQPRDDAGRDDGRQGG